jgi:hypothetical protein
MPCALAANRRKRRGALWSEHVEGELEFFAFDTGLLGLLLGLWCTFFLAVDDETGP